MTKKALIVALVLAVGIGGFAARRIMRSSGNSGAVPLKAASEVGPPRISGIVVPHHDMVRQGRADFFAEVAKEGVNPKAVILVSPNHDEAGKGAVQVSDEGWTVAEGEIFPRKDVISRLVSEGGASLEPGNFAGEHGIKLILGDIKRTFPSAGIVPIILKSSASQEKVEKVVEVLASTCENCLVVASVDFSHYQPALLANLHDETARRVLTNLDVESIYGRAETDSAPSLALLMGWARAQETKKFSEYAHTNSGELLKDADIETTTHFFGWYESGEQAKARRSVSFTIGGDMMFGRAVAHQYLPDGFNDVAENLGPRLFWGTDAGIINLEGPISATPVPDNPNPKDLIFNFPPETTGVLSYLHANVASLANNHAANQGKKGLENTRAVLEAAKIEPLGGPADADVERAVTVQGEGLRLHLVGVHCLGTRPDVGPTIKRLRSGADDRVIVFPHCGNEYQARHSAYQEKLYREWIDAGADAVIGAHPHVIQDAELYEGKPIIYSLGNLVFDQDFSVETQQGMIVSGEFTDEGLTLFGLPVQLEKYRPVLMRGAKKNVLLSRLYAPFSSLKVETAAGPLLRFPAR